MVVTVQKTIKEQVELEGQFPVYRCQYDSMYYMLLSEKEYIEVCFSSGNQKVTIDHATVAEIAGNVLTDKRPSTKVITAEEFEAAYIKATLLFDSQIFIHNKLQKAS